MIKKSNYVIVNSQNNDFLCGKVGEHDWGMARGASGMLAMFYFLSLGCDCMDVHFKNTLRTVHVYFIHFCSYVTYITIKTKTKQKKGQTVFLSKMMFSSLSAGCQFHQRDKYVSLLQDLVENSKKKPSYANILSFSPNISLMLQPQSTFCLLSKDSI